MRTRLDHLRSKLALLATAVLLAAVAPTRADAPDRLPASLKLVPADATSCSIQLRLGEQWKAMLKSKAWGKLTAMDAVAPYWEKFQEHLKDEKVKPWADMLAELFGQEVFLFTGPTYPEFVGLLQELQGANYFAPLQGALAGKPADTETRIGLLLHTL